MPIVTAIDLINKAKSEKLIIPAFNTNNIEITKAIITGAEKLNSAAIVQISPASADLSSYETIYKVFSSLADKSNAPLYMHLDHGKKFEHVKKAVFAGFNSIMIDGSLLDYEENIELTKSVAEYCHRLNIPVEAEIGTIIGKEDDMSSEKSYCTDPNVVNDFYTRTGCDTVAVSIGNVHGLNKEPKINLKLLKEIHEKTDAPLVIHGGSGIPDDILKEFKNYGVVKVNFSSELKNALIRSVGKRYVKNNKEYDIVSVTKEEIDEVEKVVEHKIKVLNHN